MNKQTSLTMEHTSAVTAETKAVSRIFGMLEADLTALPRAGVVYESTPVVILEKFSQHEKFDCN